MGATRRFVCSVVVVGAVASACGGDDSDEGSNGTAAAAPSPATQTQPSALPASTDSSTPGSDTIESSGEQTTAEAYFAELESISGDARLDRLVADCTDAGSVVVYSGDTAGEQLAEAFEAEFDVDVELYRATTETVNQRILLEVDGNQLGGDFIISDTANFAALVDHGGILTPYRSPLLEGIRPEVPQGDDLWTATHSVVFVAAWNTDLVDEGEIPTDFIGFADESWQGRLAVEIGDFDWYGAVHGYYLDQGMTEEEIDQLFMAMLDENAVLVQGHTGASEQLAAGEWDVTLTTYSTLNDQFISNGAPLAYMKSDGTVVSPAVVKYTGFGLPRTSRSPACALLWADWMITETGGGEVLGTLGWPTTSVNDDTLPEDLELIPVPEEVVTVDRARWTDAFNAYLD